MGNSGSIHNIAADHDDLHPYLQHSQSHLGEHQPLKWTQSYPRDSTHAQQHQLHHHHQQQQQQAHVKVLPDLNDGPRLRFTANGAILQSGGTISGRKESMPQPPLLQRSKTSIHYNLGNRHSSDSFNRSPENLGSLMHDREAKELAYKRFGSEPDLRTNGDDDNSALSVAKISKSKMVKNKKRRTAPPPPRDQLPAEGDHNLTPNSGHQKKLRLFKTKTESRKASVQTKLAAEASDLHFKRSTLGVTDQQIGEPPRRNMEYLPPPEPRESPPKKPPQPTMDSSWQESKVKVLSMPMPPTAFRREKSFDASLLTSHKQSIADEVGPVKNARERQRLSPGKAIQSPKVEKILASRQISADLGRPLRKSDAESGKRAAMRKYSQPAQLRSTDFKKELEEATKRRSMIVQGLDKESDDGRLRQGGQPIPVAKARVSRTKGDKPGPVPPVEPKRRIESKIPQLTKTFYFGMDGKKDTGTTRKDPDDFGKVQMDVIDEFAKNILTNRRQQRAGGYESSESALSSEEGYPMAGMTAGYEENSDGGIHVHVRPTLPRRQLEIPRFSPAAAWRMLNDEQKDAVFFGRGTKLFASDMAVEPKQPLEERIQRIYREPNPLYPDNKSGDSGISGDAGLPERTESPRQNFVTAAEQENERAAKVGPFLKPWIPQQDLDEDTSSDGGEVTKMDDTNKFSSRGHVFSLSLPRESHMSAYDEKDKPGFSSLQKLKKTVSNALFSTQDRITSYRSDNWLLSRSAPNSIENTQMLPGNSAQHQLPADADGGEHQQLVAIQPSSFSYFTGGKHVMYLPNHPIGDVSDEQHFDRIDGEGNGRSKFCEGDAVGKNKDRKYSSHNRPGQVNGGGKERESLQDVIPKVKEERTGCKRNSSKSRVHRFTFQSTVRQIERRRIAEKLSKEAEEKEAQRLSELEAMRKVEEEFQRKRAREKASIRHQLRLFSLEENQCTSLPVDWQLIESQNQRAEPDGAVSSPTPSPTSNDDPITQESNHHHQHHRKLHNPKDHHHNDNKFPATEVLSEFHTMRREYSEYRNEKKLDYYHHQNEHPSIICKIPPKNSEVYSYDDVGYGANNSAILLDNYRRDFARGRSICSSDSDLSTPSGDGMMMQRSQYRCRIIPE